MPSSTPQHSSMPCGAHELAGVEPLLPGVGGDDRREERPGRLEVVVVAVDAALGQARGLLVGQDAGADGDVEAGAGRGRAGPARAAAASCARRVRARPARCRTRTRRARAGLAGRRQHLVGVEERRGLHLGVELGRLAAEVAVLGAAAGLGRQDALDLDLGTAPRQAHLVGERGERRHVGVGQRGQLGQLVGGQLAPLVEQRVAGGGEQRPAGGRSRRHAGEGTRRAVTSPRPATVDSLDRCPPRCSSPRATRSLRPS